MRRIPSRSLVLIAATCAVLAACAGGPTLSEGGAAKPPRAPVEASGGSRMDEAEIQAPSQPDTTLAVGRGIFLGSGH